MKRSFIRQILESIDKDTISFAGGLPDEDLFPMKDLQCAAKKAFKDKKNLQYILSNGIKPLREKTAKFYNDEGFETDIDNLLITTGSQQAMYIIANYFAKKDIVVENPSYLGAINILKSNGLNMKGVPLEYDGIDIAKFKKEYKKTKLAYLIPDFQNPKSSFYSKDKRKKVANIVKQNGGYIIEDAPYSQLYFKKGEKSISSLIPNNSLHLGSFSKTLAPSFRLGWIRANKEIIKELTMIKETIDLHTNGISQYILNEYLEDESRYFDHIKVLRKEYEKKMEYFAKCLDKYLPQFIYEKPKGGMFIYGKLPNKDTKKLVYEALENKIVYVPGGEFYIDDGGVEEIRFNYSHSSKEEIKEGLKRLAKIL